MMPVKPFASYKWRWLTVEPSEGLLNPPIFLGVLRVLARHENAAFSSGAIKSELGTVETDNKHELGRLSLARPVSRNLFRNSKQYWTGTGLLLPERGVIHLTDLGRKVADGKITQGSFAALMVQQTVLPNPGTYSAAEIAKWRASGLQIRPLALILEIINDLGRRHGGLEKAYISPRELIKIVIPLAGALEKAPAIADNVALHRQGKLNIAGWPDCAPGANDHRLAREFLLFLSNYGICRRIGGPTNLDEKYYLEELFDSSAIGAVSASIFASAASATAAIAATEHSPIPSIIERTRTTVTVLSRPGQSGFRDKVLKAYGRKCYLTGELILETLEAAHIIPVEHGGSDASDNGLCLRVDVHRLFDAGHLRLKPDGALAFSDAIKASKNYTTLPKKIAIPAVINPANVAWRDKYY